jgi:ribonucleoside-diphosphate reductase alpha chain
MREDILRKRYYLRDEDGNILENWEGLCRRVASALAESKEQEDEFFRVMFNCLFLPNSPALMNAGKGDFSLSACFVLPVEDSMEGIFDAVKKGAIIQKMGGGTGFDFSRLRPEGDPVKTTKGVASGPCSFIRVFDTATEVTKQGGTRRGSNMGLLRIDHPDVEKFISLKREEGVLTNFNLSVAITDEFMDALKRGADFELRFNGKVRRKVSARSLWERIVDGAWKNGEPGVIFLDRINEKNPTPHIGRIEATNPCGEQPLLPYEACVLGSINLAAHLKDREIDWNYLEKTVRTGVRMLDRIIDVQSYPLPEIEKMHKGNRKVGLGIMGWADLLLLLKIKYDSNEAVSLAEKVMSFIERVSVDESQVLAGEKGVFPNWEGSIWAKRNIKMRNATTTTIAPTGSISIIAGCSSGIEPIFAWETIQRRPVGEHVVVHPIYEEYREKHPGEPLPPWFVTAREISPEWHVRMQAAFQKYTHNAVSKTVNLPNSATKEDVEKIFLLAYELGCKGVTVYRDGSRKVQVISDRTQEAVEEELGPVEESRRVRVKTPEGNVYIHITMRGDRPCEIFVNSPVQTKYADVYEALARVFSTALRHRVPLKRLLEQLEAANEKFGSVVSPVYAIVRAFRILGLNGGYQKCPECGNVLVSEEGCLKCHSCGFSKC